MNPADSFIHPSRILAALVSFGAALFAVGGTVLMLFGKSPFHISIREPGVDWLYYHVAYFGSSLLLGWIVFPAAALQKSLVVTLLAATGLYLRGFFFLR